MSTNIRFIVYNAFGIGGTIKTVFNFANYFQKTGKYSVEIISVKKTRETPILKINPKVKLLTIQDAQRNVRYSKEDSALLALPSKLIHPEEDLYQMFNAYTDKYLQQILTSIYDGVIISTMPSLNVLVAAYVDNNVLKIGQEHKSYWDHSLGIQNLISENYGKLDVLTILTEQNRNIYERKIKGDLPIFVLGNGTEQLSFRANLKNHIIVAAGRYSEEKGYEMLIKAFGLIAGQFPDWILNIYGNGILVEEYIKIINQCNIADRVFLKEGTEHLNTKLSEAAFQICSSHRESFGMTIIEGFAMGLPCISFACDGPMEIITDGHDGILVSKENIEELASAMAHMMSDEKYRTTLGKNAYETSKKYDIKVIGAKFEKLIETQIAQKKRSCVMTDNKNRSDNLRAVLTGGQVINGQKNGAQSFCYEEMVQIANDGKVGIKTILKMIKGWGKYKLSIRK